MTLFRTFLLVLFAATCQEGHLAEKDSFLEKFQKRGGVRHFFEDISSDSITELQFHKNNNVSIYAAWIKCKEKCRLSKDDSEIERHKNEFLGFASGKLNTSIPCWWKKELQKIGFDRMIELPKLADETPCFTKTDWFSHHKKLVIEQITRTELKGRMNGQSFSVPWQIDLRPPGFNRGAIAASPLEKGGAIWALEERGNLSFDIIRTGENGNVTWRAKVNSYRHHVINGRIGILNGLLEIMVRDNKVYLFGVDEVNIYVDVFSLDAGRPLFRFTTLY